MLKHTFIHAKGASAITERNLWSDGIFDWSLFLDNLSSVNLPDRKKKSIKEEIENSEIEVSKSNYMYFKNKLPRNELWRLYPQVRDSCVFLDIETTGLGFGDKITVIGLYNGKEVKTYVYGRNLDEFKEEIEKYSMIVSFNGTCFDLPFIKKRFPELNLNQMHVDLRYFLRRLGLSGGLKVIESRMSIKRTEETTGLSGWDAVRLWHRYERGDKESLDLLLKYNNEDIINLKKILEITYPKLKENLLGIKKI